MTALENEILGTLAVRPDAVLVEQVTIEVPETVEDMQVRMELLGHALNAGGWATAAIVYAFVAPQQGKRTSITSDGRLTVEQFTELGIRGLKSVNTVRKYWQRWQEGVKEGWLEPAVRGQSVDLPDRDWEVEVEPVTDADERYTPLWLFEAMGAEFDIDLAAPPGGISYIPAKEYYTKEDDALVQDWNGKFAWCNPPYSLAAAFGNKWLDEIKEGVWLGPISHGTSYRFRFFEEGLIWFPQDIRFDYRDRHESVKFPIFLGGFGERGEAAVMRLVDTMPEAGIPMRRAEW